MTRLTEKCIADIVLISNNGVLWCICSTQCEVMLLKLHWNVQITITCIWKYFCKKKNLQLQAIHCQHFHCPSAVYFLCVRQIHYSMDIKKIMALDRDRNGIMGVKCWAPCQYLRYPIVILLSKSWDWLPQGKMQRLIKVCFVKSSLFGTTCENIQAVMQLFIKKNQLCSEVKHRWPRVIKYAALWRKCWRARGKIKWALLYAGKEWNDLPTDGLYFLLTGRSKNYK